VRGTTFGRRGRALVAGLLAWQAAAVWAGERTETIQAYLRDSAFLEGPWARVGDLATIAGSTEEARARAASCILPFPLFRPTLLPARSIQLALAAAGITGVSVSGTRVAVVPATGMSAREKVFYDRLLRAVDAAESLRDGRTEVQLVSSEGVLPAASGADVRFGSPEIGSIMGRMAGGGRLAVRSGETEGSAQLWLYTFVPAATPENAGARGMEIELSTALPDGRGESIGAARSRDTAGASERSETGRSREVTVVRAGDAVTIIFRKGSIVVTSPGRAQSAGALSETVRVRALEGGRAYTATVVNATEVAVDVP
jgi:hypothetical protein